MWKSKKAVMVMAIFRVEKNKDFTIMSNYHLKDKNLSLKAKGLLSLMLSLPDNWDYTVKGLVAISKDGTDSINSALHELEKNGYLIRTRHRNQFGQLGNIEYVVLEKPKLENPILVNQKVDKKLENPQEYPQKSRSRANATTENPKLENPIQANPAQANPAQLNTKELNTKEKNERMNEKAHVREKICENISYQYLCTIYDFELIDEIVDVMVKSITSNKPYLPVGKFQRVETSELANQFMNYTEEHIEFACNSLERVGSNIDNRLSYIRTVLFNLPDTMKQYELTV